MKTLLNLTKVRNVKVFGLDDFTPMTVKLIVNYYNDEPSFECAKVLTNLCDGSQIYTKEKVEKAYNDIKQALLKDEKYVEIEL
jgi:3-methyladenine DNA glycosylase AlkC